MYRGLGLGIVVATVLSCRVEAGIIRVPSEAPTVQIAIQLAHPFDTIIVAPGVYFEAIHFGGKVIAVQSEDPHDAATVATTVIDAGGLGTVVTLAGSEGSVHSTLNGFTVQHGTIGIDGNGTQATIQNCVVRENSSIGLFDVQGDIRNCEVLDNANVGLWECHGTIQRCRIGGSIDGLLECDGSLLDSLVLGPGDVRAAAADGHGLRECHGIVERGVISGHGRNGLTMCNVTIRQSIISGNGGDGLYHCHGERIENSVVAGNQQHGVAYSSLDVLHCTITGNRGCGLSFHQGGRIEHCIIWRNDAGALLNSVTPTFSGTVHPYFLQPGHWDPLGDVWIEGDYHVAPDSPYIDAGDPHYGAGPSDADLDLDGFPRVAGDRIDIGAYEFQTPCVGSDFDGDGHADPCDGDVDNDGIGNSLDACDFTPAAIPVDAAGRPMGDLNLDCRVDLRDYASWQRTITGP